MKNILNILKQKIKDKMSNYINFYNDNFYLKQQNESYNNAKIIVPEIIEIVSPQSVIDVGCGVGAWLKIFKDLGVTEILGIDSDDVPVNQLLINPSEFQTANLENKIQINKKYDLAISIEVAEHISKKNDLNFINNLTHASDIIIFSAAIPKQGGTHHVNEQWPEYWQQIFKKFNYEAFDAIRPKLIWRHDIQEIYKQNIFLFINKNNKNFNFYKSKYSYPPQDIIIITKNIFHRHTPILSRLLYLCKKHIFKK